MTYEELKIKLDLYDPEDVLSFVGRRWNNYWFVVCDEGDCHIFQQDGTEDDIRKVNIIANGMIHEDVKKIVIPDSVTCIGGDAFYYRCRLMSVTIPESVTGIGAAAFGGCSKLTNITIPDSVVKIGYSVFYSCSGLTGITIPAGVTSIRASTFEDCSGLTSMSIPDSVDSIGSYAFSGCIELTSVTIGSGVTSIGEFAFNNCYSLKSLIFKGKTMDDIETMDCYSWGINDESIIKCI